MAALVSSTAPSVLHAPVSWYPNSFNSAPSDETSLQEFLSRIGSDRYKDKILALRNTLDTHGKDAYTRQKELLPAITPCGTFAPKRSKLTMTRFSHICHIDFDGLEDLQGWKQQLTNDPYICYAFISASAHGLKIGVEIPPLPDEPAEQDPAYKTWWQSAQTYFQTTYHFPPGDPSTKDISRLCYISWDRECYINPTAHLFDKATAPLPQKPYRFIVPNDSPDQFSTRTGQRALTTACTMLDASVKGNRHATRTKVGYLIGGYIAGGILHEEEALTTLEPVVERNTTNFSAAWQTILDCITAGKGRPFDLATLEEERNAWVQTHRPSPHAAPAKNGTTPQTAQPIIVTMSTVEEEPIFWMWWPYFAYGKMSLLDGDPGIGKSLLVLQLAANLSRGYPFPDQRGKPTLPTGAPQATLLLSTEDGLADTVRPRLNKSDADCTKIHVLTGWLDAHDAKQMFTFQHLPILEQAVKMVQPTFVVIDPIQAYLGAIDMHRANETRPLLSALSALAEQYRFCLLCIRHPAKPGQGNAGKAIHRGLGSIDFIGNARTAMFVEEHPLEKTQVLLMQTKSNIGPMGMTQIFDKVEGGFEWTKQVTRLTAETISGSGKGPDPHAFLEAAFWLEKTMDAAPLPLLSKELLEQAKEVGIAERTLWRAKKALGIQAKKHGEGWMWHLPPLPIVTTTLYDIQDTQDILGRPGVLGSVNVVEQKQDSRSGGTIV